MTTLIQAARSQKWYGCRPDTPDLNDHEFRDAAYSGGALPETLDLRAHDFGVYDQGAIGSCTANGALGAYRDLLAKESLADFDGSRLAQYWWTRFLEGTTDSDAGAEIRDAVKVLTKSGVAPEKDCPYVISKFKSKPTLKATRDAKKHVAIAYERVSLSEIAIKSALVKNANVIIGISVYSSFESSAVARTGLVPLPKRREALLGGHCMRVRGWTEDARWIVANSWGKNWGERGYCYMPLGYLFDSALASDFWTLSVCT